MSYIVSLFILYFASILSFSKRDYGLASFFLLVVMWVLFSGSLSNADFDNYNHLFDAINRGGDGFLSSQVGLVLLMKLATSLGFDYNQFLMLVSSLGMLLIASTVYKYTNKPMVVFLLYFIFPFALDVVQVKHFCAMSIVVFSLRYLVSSTSIANYKYLFGIMIASSIHYISIIFLPLLFIKNINNKNLFLLVLIFSFIFVGLDKSGLLVTLSTLIVAEQRISGYFENRAQWGFLVQFVIQLTMLALLFLSRKLLIRHNKSSQFVEMVFKINIYLLILFPFYMINGTFERAFRMMYIPNFILFSIVFSVLDVRRRFFYLGFLMCVNISLFMWYIFTYYRDSVFFPIFNENYFFKFLSGS